MSNSRIFGDCLPVLTQSWLSFPDAIASWNINWHYLAQSDSTTSFILFILPLTFLSSFPIPLHLSFSLSLGHSPCHSCCQAGYGVMLGGMEPDGERDGEVCYSLFCHTSLEWLAASLISMSSRALQLSLSHTNIKTDRTDVRHNWPQENGYESDRKELA